MNFDFLIRRLLSRLENLSRLILHHHHYHQYRIVLHMRRIQFPRWKDILDESFDEIIKIFLPARVSGQEFTYFTMCFHIFEKSYV